MTIEDRQKIISNDYLNSIVEEFEIPQRFQGLTININNKYKVVYFHSSLGTTISLINEISYAVIPKVYGLLDSTNLDAMGVGKVQNVPQLGLRGEGVLLGFVDTGIDYTNPIFQNTDGTTRIVSIWDQTIENLDAPENIFYYGVEYNRDQINEAIKSTAPYSIVLSRDDIGHGTMLAGIAGGARNEENSFQGVVPLAEFVVVKLKETKQNLKDYYYIPEGIPAYGQDDIMFGIQYLVNLADQLNRPIIICLGLGTNQGGHAGNDVLSQYITLTGDKVGRAFVLAAGNEGNSKNHYYGEIDKSIGYNEVEVLVGENEKGLTMELWGYPPSTYSIDILSPSGQYVPQIVGRLGESREIDFIFENTTIYVDHVLIEAQTGAPFILIRGKTPAAGLWRFRVYARGGDNLSFHMWLPLSNFKSPNTYFINSNPYTTITSPANGLNSVTVTAYNAYTNGIYIEASRGYTKNNLIKPDVAAPGVDVLVPVPGNQFIRASGTSIAAAHTAGLAAMVFEWGIVRGNYQYIKNANMQFFLIRGVSGEPSVQYPNRVWGYGTVNIYNTFLGLST